MRIGILWGWGGSFRTTFRARSANYGKKRFGIGEREVGAEPQACEQMLCFYEEMIENGSLRLHQRR